DVQTLNHMGRIGFHFIVRLEVERPYYAFYPRFRLTARAWEQQTQMTNLLRSVRLCTNLERLVVRLRLAYEYNRCHPPTYTEVLRGLSSRPEVRELLQIRPPREVYFNAVIAYFEDDGLRRRLALPTRRIGRALRSYIVAEYNFHQ